MLLDELHVDDRADAGGQAVQHEGGREGLAELSSSVLSSVALTADDIVARQPNWVRMKAGVFSSLITRCSE